MEQTQVPSEDRELNSFVDNELSRSKQELRMLAQVLLRRGMAAEAREIMDLLHYLELRNNEHKNRDN